jgi:SAM-dependent methyltransferase
MAFRYAEYDAFAWFYNRYWGQDSVRRFLPVIEKLVLPHLAPHARILDLCCGTGQLAQVLAQRGYQVTGIDGSEEMIRYARINASAVELIVEDARSFHLPEIYHAVVSVYDSLNHIMSMEELSLVFQNVQLCLLPGGLFLFDLNMAEGYKTRWRGSFGIVEDDHVCVVRASFDEGEKVGQMAITMFRSEGVVWRRSDVTLLQRCYSDSEIRSGLEAAGFTDIQALDAQNDLGWSREAGRTFFLTRKAGGESGGGQ